MAKSTIQKVWIGAHNHERANGEIIIRGDKFIPTEGELKSFPDLMADVGSAASVREQQRIADEQAALAALNTKLTEERDEAVKQLESLQGGNKTLATNLEEKEKSLSELKAELEELKAEKAKELEELKAENEALKAASKPADDTKKGK